VKIKSFAAVLALAVIGAAVPVESVRAQAAPGKITISVDKPGAKIGPLFYGLMTEEINHSYDGGLYAELIQNRIFQDGGGGGRGRGGAAGGAPGAPAHWSLFGTGGTLAIDTNNTVNTGALNRSLRLDITEASPTAPVGVANDGYWGIPVKPSTTYHASFYAKSGNGFTGQLTDEHVAFIARQSAYVDPEIEAMGKDFRHACRVKVITRDGRSFEKLELYRRGSPEKPLSSAEIVDKFHNVVAPCVARADAQRIVDLVERLETMADLKPLIEAVSAPVKEIGR